MTAAQVRLTAAALCRMADAHPTEFRQPGEARPGDHRNDGLMTPDDAASPQPSGALQPMPAQPGALTQDAAPSPVSAHSVRPVTGAVPTAPPKVPWVAVVVYTVLAMALAWAVTLPLWLGDGLADPAFGWTTPLMMYTPTVAALIVTFFIVKPKHKARYLGLTPFKPVWRSIILILAWPVIFGIVSVLAALLTAAFGLAELGYSTEALEPLAEQAGIPVDMLVLLQFVTIPLVVVQATIFAFGEELGWRGFLVPALAPLGFWKMSLISGVIWGVWHAPLILLGYNFGRTDALGVLMMIGFTFFVGVLLNWSRMWCRNVYVAAVGHGALNSVITIGIIFLVFDNETPDGFLQTAIGLPGWIVMAVLIALMAVTGFFGRRLPQPLVTEPRKVSVKFGQTQGVTPEWAQQAEQQRAAQRADTGEIPRQT
ncbi:MAG: CPBP family glutamic-type intramembrane protease [Agrococcus casei]|uniref:CPBP family glutamic-type intramembrane protease n=2 Tax=Agrococcus casei TaxID=343512 RepID=UPI003F8F198A